MNIIIANQKGGVGKTTHCILFANYLSILKKEEILVLDLDFQGSISDKWRRDGKKFEVKVFNELIKSLNEYPTLKEKLLNVQEENQTIETFKNILNEHGTANSNLSTLISLADEWSWEAKQNYSVISADIEDYPTLKTQIDQLESGFVIIDLPGRLDSNVFVQIYQGANLILCPFSYDEITIESTYVFTKVVKQLNPTVPILFLPTKTRPSVKYELKNQIREFLSQYGTIAEDMPHRVAFERLDTLSISNEIINEVTTVYEPIYTTYLKS